MTVTMWEVRAADGASEALLAWVTSQVGQKARVYRSADPAAARVVAIGPPDVVAALVGCPADLVTRPPQAWEFDEV